MRRALLTVALVGALGGSAAWAAGSLPALSSSRDAVAGIIDDAGGVALFSVANMVPGQSVSRCVATANVSNASQDIGLYGTQTGTLGPYLQLTVQRGSTTVPYDRGCAAFQPTGPVLYNGALAAYPSDAGHAIVDGGPQAPNEIRAYRFTLTLGNDNAAQGRSYGGDLVFASGARQSSGGSGGSGGGAPQAGVAITKSGVGCDQVAFGASGGKTSTQLIKTSRLSGRVTAKLFLNVFGFGSSEHLGMFTGLRVHGKTLLLTNFAHVEYSVNGRRVARLSVRPFTAKTKPGVLGTGRSVLRVVVRDRHGNTLTSAFKLSTTARKVGGKVICVVS